MSVDVAEARRAAAGRLRDRENTFESHTEAEELRARLEGRTLPRQDIYAPRFRPPGNLGEWLDDRVLEASGLAGFPGAPVLAGILEGMREGPAGAVNAVRGARQLDRAAQAAVFRNIQALRRDAAGRFGADTLLNAAEGEWARLRLAAEDPDGDG